MEADASTFAREPVSTAAAWPSYDAIPGLIWAFRLHHDGGADVLPIDEPLDVRHDGRLWLHFNLADQRACRWLETVHLPPQARRLLLSSDNFQQLHASDDCVYGVLPDLVRDVDGNSDQTGFLHFVMTEGLLVSGRYHALSAADATRRLLESGHCIANVGELLETIVEHIAEAMDRTVDRIATDIDTIEENMTGETADQAARQKLGRLRRTCVRLHRQLSGLRAVFQRLEHKVSAEIPQAMRIRAAKLAQRLDGLDHDVVELRERSRLLQEELQLVMEEESNKHLHALSVLTALLLPATFVTGVFGMNVKGLPFTDGESGFGWSVLMIIAASAAVYLLMRRLGIIK